MGTKKIIGRESSCKDNNKGQYASKDSQWIIQNDVMPNTKSNNSILIKEDFALNDKSLPRFMNAAMTTIIPITAF